MKFRIVLLAICSAFFFTACAGAGGELEITGARANLTLPSETGAVYLTITNHTGEDEALIGASIPGCGAVELHEMVMSDGVMRMNEVEGGRIEIPAGVTVELKQGGLHVMCLRKTGEYVVGETVTVSLEFEKAGVIEVEAEIIEPG